MIEHFDEKAFEQEIADLSKEVAAAATPEAPKEAIRSVIGEKLYAGGSEGVPHAAAPQQSQAVPQAGPLPTYAASVPAETRLKVEQLLAEAFNKGIMRSIREVRKSDPLVMDLFHDAITERLYTAFKKRKIIR